MNWLFSMRLLARRLSYGGLRVWVQTLAVALMVVALPAGGRAADRPVKIVALGDSLTAGLGLPAQDAVPARLEQALKAKGRNVEIVNAGVSGDTASAGLSRLDWSVPQDTDAVILELGANDALRGIDPKITREALDRIVVRLRERKIEVLLCGMKAPRNLGADYAAAFDPIYPEIAARRDVLFYPFFLEGVASDPKFAQADGMHPNATGVTRIVEGLLPRMEELIARVRAKAHQNGN
jgi:acyl-CoA thioesterase-1